MPEDHLHFVTGRLAHPALERVLAQIAPQAGFSYSVDVLPITVAALMTPAWIAKHWQVPAKASRIIIPGYCEGDMNCLTDVVARPVERGPRDLRRLPEFFAHPRQIDEIGAYDIEILAEINHCPRFTVPEIVGMADQFARDGADVIDLGCDPGYRWPQVADAVRALRDRGLRVSIDSMDSAEVAAATKAGAELVLSVNSSNREAALDWGVEVVVIPDDPRILAGLAETVGFLADREISMRLDPILEPISFGFAESLGRYLEVRRDYPDAEMMMGIGNLTELTDSDSVGINVMLLGFCQELGIRSILTTQAINWTRTCVRECDLARRLMYHAVRQEVLPKHLEPDLIMLRDETITPAGSQEIEELSESIRDHNYRILVDNKEIHLLSSQVHLKDRDPFLLMEQLLTSGPEGRPPANLTPSHSFYLGYEMAKARIALALGKTYEQDEPLDWGLATPAEETHYLRGDTRSGHRDIP